MNEWLTYCSACDARVLLRFDPGANRPLTATDLTCLDENVSCTGAECPLVGASPSELRDRLEFLPPELAGGAPRGFEEAQKLVAKGRAAAVRRGKGYPGPSEG